MASLLGLTGYTVAPNVSPHARILRYMAVLGRRPLSDAPTTAKVRGRKNTSSGTGRGWTGRPVTSRRGSGEFSDTSVRDLRRGFAPPTPSCRLRRTVPFRDHGPSLRSPSVVARRRTGRLLVWA